MSGKKIIFLSILGLLIAWAAVLMLFGQRVTGVVTDAKSGKPIPGAFVRIGTISTQTDDKGNFNRWCFMPSSANITIAHPAYLPADKPMAVFDFDKPLKISMTQAGYEELLTNANIYLESLHAFVVRTATDDITREKDGKVTVNRTENVITYTNNVISYAVESSSNLDDKIIVDQVIVEGSDPNAPGSIKLLPGKPSPIIYIKEQEMKDWIKFSVFDRPDFEIPYTDKNPKGILAPLAAYGNSSEFELSDAATFAKDGQALIKCKMYWPKDSLLRGKSITYYFKKDNGNWYSIEFADTGENPISKPGVYYFQLLDVRPNIVVKIPENAKPYKE